MQIMVVEFIFLGEVEIHQLTSKLKMAISQAIQHSLVVLFMLMEDIPIFLIIISQITLPNLVVLFTLLPQHLMVLI